MKKCFVYRLLPVSVGFAALSGAALAQDLQYDTPGTATSFQNQITVNLVTTDTYFGMLGNSFGYAGIQAQSPVTTHIGIFSIWDQNGEETTIAASNPNLSWENNGRFGGEGTGCQLEFYYNWVAGTAYRCAYRVYVDPNDSTGNHLLLSGFFYDSGLAAWIYVGTFRALTNGQVFPSYAYSFNENYGGISGNRQATMSNAWWYLPSSGWSHLTSGSVFNIPSGPSDYGQILTSASGFEFNSNSSSSTKTQNDWDPVSYSPSSSEKPLYVPYLLSCGNASPAGGSSNGTNTWEPDGYWTPGDWNYTYSDPTSVSTTGVTNPAPQAVYQHIRGGDNFTYNLSALKPSTSYTVRLHFCENYDTTGQRLQNVFINGTQVLSNFDVYAAAGGKYKAVVKQFTATADSTGTIKINFQRKAGSDWANVCGIDVH